MENAVLLLAVLACPVGMGVMMWMMSRGRAKEEDAAEPRSSQPASLEVLREEQRHIEGEIQRLEEASGGATEPVGRARS